jgi:hypothetical protein
MTSGEQGKKTTIGSVLIAIFGLAVLLAGISLFGFMALHFISGYHLYGASAISFVLICSLLGMFIIYVGNCMMLRGTKYELKVSIAIYLAVFLGMCLFVVLYQKQLPFDWLIDWKHLYNW